MPVLTDEENAKLAFRQMERQESVDIPASDLGEVEVYVTESYAEMETRSFDGLDPREYAEELAQQAARSYAKKEYTGLREHKRDFERKYERWANRAAERFHRDDLEIDPHEPIADRVRSELEIEMSDDDFRSEDTTP